MPPAHAAFPCPDMFGWLKSRRAAPEIPLPLWHAVLARYPFLSAHGADDLARLRLLSAHFLHGKEFHGTDGLPITDEVALSIAAQAVLPLLHLGRPGDPTSALKWYDDFVTVVVHRSEVVARRTATDEAGVVHHWREVLAGEAMDQGPVMLNWQDVAAAGETAHAGFNVVIHEFVHKIDMRDGAADGCPPLASRGARNAWMALLQSEYLRFRENVAMAERFGGAPVWLDTYAATAIEEFFAVACEAYFVSRERFGSTFPELTVLFDSFFKPNRAPAGAHRT